MYRVDSTDGLRKTCACLRRGEAEPTCIKTVTYFYGHSLYDTILFSDLSPFVASGCSTVKIASQRQKIVAENLNMNPRYLNISSKCVKDIQQFTDNQLGGELREPIVPVIIRC